MGFSSSRPLAATETGESNVHHGAYDRLRARRCPWELCDCAGRELKPGSSLDGRLHGARRHGVGEAILGAASTLPYLAVQRVGLRDWKQRPTR